MRTLKNLAMLTIGALSSMNLLLFTALQVI